MRFTSQATSDGVSERHFLVDDVPGVLWTPAGADAGVRDRRPLILIGHGGGQHKAAPGVVHRAHRFVAGGGFAVAAIDAPGHGGRPRTEQDERLIAAFRAAVAAGQPVGPHVARLNAALAERAVPEWRAVLAGLRRLDDVGPDGPVGYWGMSLGASIGISLAAAESRIAAAVVGLAGGDGLRAVAARVTVPVEFLLQWDDEAVPRDDGLALFDAFASEEKTLHANPGPHAAIPEFELESALAFFRRHLR